MSKYILLSLLLLPCITACSSLPEPKDRPVVRFALREDAIQSWREHDDGLAVQLSDEGRCKIASLTRNNKGAELEVYVNRTLVTTSVIDTPLMGYSIYIPVDDDSIESVEAQMPAAKRADS